MRPRTTWALLAISVAVVLGVMAAVSWAVLALDARRIQSERQAIVEELVRLSLWRLDSTTTPLLSREIAEAGEAPPAGLPDGVRARFVFAADDVTVLGAPDGATASRLRELLRTHGSAFEFADGTRPVTLAVRPDNPAPELVDQQARNANEYYKRVASVQDNVSAYTSSWNSRKSESMENPIDHVEVDRLLGRAAPDRDMMRPLWWGEELVLVRRVVDGDGVRLEGSWIDWPELRGMLLLEIADLWPSAALVPADADTILDEDRRLATLPVRLEVGTAGLDLPGGTSPLRLALAVGWVFVLLATSALVVLLRASLALSERRAAFVSAVTHELRTPLTTFRMYTEMLGEGMVEDKRERYVATLRREADRLGHLVENVLAYARIESDRAVRTRERLLVGELLERCADRLVDRAHAGGVELGIDVPEDVGELHVAVDAAAIEQILFNLVDNATKYGATGSDARVRLVVERVADGVAIHVRDSGPGIAADERRSIFAPFAKGRAHAAGTKPGVGLGLALSRRLAEQMGGRLELVASDRGADFVLRLPVA